jgi:phage terminase large subunit
VEFIGADDQQKLRGAKRTFLYCNEANELNYKKEFFQLLIRTQRKTFIDFNPDDETVRINTEIEQKRKLKNRDVKVIISTYKDNPFLSE